MKPYYQSEILNCPSAAPKDPSTILREDLNLAGKALKKRKAPVDDAVPEDPEQARGDCTISVLATTANNIVVMRMN